MGLPIDRLIIATNENDILARALREGRYEVRGVKPTQSPSMDIQVSSNFERLLFDACGRDAAALRAMMASLDQARTFDLKPDILAAIRADFDADRVSEEETRAEIAGTWARDGVLLDPHTAVGAAVARRARAKNPAAPMIVAGTAHPAKFPEAMRAATGVSAPLPAHLADLMTRPELFEVVPNDIAAIERLIRGKARASLAQAAKA